MDMASGDQQVLAIYGPLIYTAPYVMFLIRANDSTTERQTTE